LNWDTMPAMNVAGNLFLIGLMGAGKTTVGKILAKRLHWPFFDSDHEIEARTGVRIPIIFEIEGEEGFRNREVETIAELVSMRNVVLATGGGAVLRAENQRALKENGTVIYLRANVDDLYERTKHDRNRPLLQTADPKAKLQALFEQRDPIYRQLADVVIDTSRQNVNSLVAQLERKLQAHLQQQQNQHNAKT
jgi:shikimate kinase